MDETQAACTTTVVNRDAVLLSCGQCGPVGVYLCGADVAVLHHISTAHSD